MADELVKLLNSCGYQPVLLQKTRVKPPDSYYFVDKRLIRRARLRQLKYFSFETGERPSLGGGFIREFLISVSEPHSSGRVSMFVAQTLGNVC